MSQCLVRFQKLYILGQHRVVIVLLILVTHTHHVVGGDASLLLVQLLLLVIFLEEFGGELELLDLRVRYFEILPQVILDERTLLDILTDSDLIW